MTPSEFLLELAEDIVTLPELAARLSIPHARLRKMAAVPVFPRPLRTIAGAKVWSLSEVQTWLASTKSEPVPALADLRVIVQQLVPSEWAGTSVNLGCYRIEHAEPIGPSGAAIFRRTTDTAISAFVGEVEYYDPGKTLVTSHNGGIIQMTGHSAPIRVGPGQFLFIATRYGGEEDSAPIRTMRGLVCAIAGRNAAFEEVFRAHVKPEPNSVQLTADSSLNPATFPEIGRVHAVLESTHHALLALDRSPHGAKVAASLDWFEQSLEGRNTDGFVKCWIALETLMMYDANVAPIVDRLGSIFGLKENAVHDQLGPRALQKLRNRVVHSGDVAKIHHKVLDHISAMYVDLLRDVLGLPAKRHMLELSNTRLVLEHIRALVRGAPAPDLPSSDPLKRYVRIAMDLQFAEQLPA